MLVHALSIFRVENDAGKPQNHNLEPLIGYDKLITIGSKYITSCKGDSFLWQLNYSNNSVELERRFATFSVEGEHRFEACRRPRSSQRSRFGKPFPIDHAHIHSRRAVTLGSGL